MMYSWSGAAENGTAASLSFDGSRGSLSIEGDNGILIDGLCIAGNKSLTICDEKSGVNYTFSYTLYGDRVELTYNGSTLSLQKNDRE